MAARKTKVKVQSVTPFLWYDDNAAEAARFYASVFQDARVTNETPMSAEFEIAGQRFIALNGGPSYRLTPAFSIFVSVTTQRQVDELWERLCEGGRPDRCGWLVDRYGLSWQIIPERLSELLFHEDQEVAGRAMKAMLGMSKIDIAALEAAARGDDDAGKRKKNAAGAKRGASKGAKKKAAAPKRKTATRKK